MFSFWPFFSGRYGGWHSRDTDRASNKKSLPRIMVYIMGGTCFSEFRVGYEITNERKNWEVIVGKCYIYVCTTNSKEHLYVQDWTIYSRNRRPWLCSIIPRAVSDITVIAWVWWYIFRNSQISKNWKYFVKTVGRLGRRVTFKMCH